MRKKGHMIGSSESQTPLGKKHASRAKLKVTYHIIQDKITNDMLNDDNWEKIALLQEKWALVLEAKREAESLKCNWRQSQNISGC